ncbi:VENN motif pre-toxin domain-containing protein [Escherichia coli]
MTLLLNDKQYNELCEAAEGRNLGAVFSYSEPEEPPPLNFSFEERKKIFLWVLTRLLKEGRIKLAKHGKFLEGSVDEQVERFRQAFPKTEEEMEDGIWFFDESCPGALFGCLKMALSNGPDKPFTEQDVVQRAYNNGMAASGFGTGGKYQQAIQAATAAVQGLAGGNLSAALAGGAAPYLAEVVKTMTTDLVTGEVNKAANVAVHAVVNAALAVAQGNNALAGAAGAATGEMVGMIATQMYGKSVSELSETEKQTLSTLATVAAGLAGGLTGNSTASAAVGAQSGKNAVENNYLSYDEAHAFDREMTACRKAGGDCGDIQNKYAVLSAENRQKLHIDVAADPLTALSGEDKWNIEGGLSAAGRPGWLYGSLTNQEVKDYVTEGNSYDLNYLNSNTSKGDRALAFFGEPENYWGTVAGAGSLLTSSATLTEKFVSAGLSYGANGAVQIGTGNIGDKFDYLSFMMSGLTGVGTAGKGYYANQLLGAGSAYMGSQIEGQDSTASVVGSMAGTGLGYNVGASITNKLEAQYIKNQLGMDASKYSLQYSEKSIGYGMYQGGQMSSIPGTFGGFVGSFVSEGASSATQKEVDGDKK